MHVLMFGDCRKLSGGLEDQVDCIITDPPYPDYHVERYQYEEGLIDWLDRFKCRQFVFWSAKVDFPLSYTAIHIWDKMTGAGSQYERIFERNGGAAFRIFHNYLINSTVAASYARDVFTGHPSQKPIGLIKKLIVEYTKPGDTIFDPFAGSGSTGAAAVMTGRNSIMIERNGEYMRIMEKRMQDIQQQMNLPFEEDCNE